MDEKSYYGIGYDEGEASSVSGVRHPSINPGDDGYSEYAQGESDGLTDGYVKRIGQFLRLLPTSSRTIAIEHFNQALDDLAEGRPLRKGGR